MSQYTKTTNFTAKDALPDGNPSKVVTGVDFDLEFDNIQTSNNTKVDAVGNGLSLASTTLSFDIASLAQVTPAATDEVLIGDASDSVNPKSVLFSTFESTLNHDSLAGFVSDEHVAHSGISVIAGTLLTGGGTIDGNVTLNVDEASINHDSLTGFVSDEHVAHAGVTMTAGTGLSGGGTIAATRTFNLDISGLTSMTAAPVGTDSFLYNDNGTMKQMTYNQAALPSANDSNARTFADTDVGEIVYYTGTGGHTFTMPTGVGQDDCFIIIVNSGSGTLTLAGSSVTINSANSLLDVPQGGIACLIRESSTVWFAGGNLQ